MATKILSWSGHIEFEAQSPSGITERQKFVMPLTGATSISLNSADLSSHISASIDNALEVFEYGEELEIACAENAKLAGRIASLELKLANHENPRALPEVEPKPESKKTAPKKASKAKS